ncbi:hypothetical protein GCM10009554_53250 [Kribbella koreensis]|uniref:Uncharacterized protein n=1 Tax=Kribbella koreensis TaxID=57909 RepID=A0ABP4BLH4_9ACTN
MAVLGTFEDDDYLPEFGTLTVRDAASGHVEYVDAGLLEQYATEAQPCGTIARAGAGWLEAASGDLPCHVRIQVHDSPPNLDEPLEWVELVELPYRSASGVIGLTSVTGSWPEEHLPLGAPGPYRVRVAHQELPRPTATDEAGEPIGPWSLWQLDFWPVAEVEPPRWLRRSKPAVPAGDPGWGYLLGYEAAGVITTLEYVSGRDDGTSLEELAEWASTHSWGDDWLDQPLTPADRAYQLMTLATVAEQLGRAEPTSRRMLPPLFTALGCLTFGGDRYRRSPVEPLPQEVLRIPPETLTALETYQSMAKYTSFTSDLMTIALWGGADQTTVAALAERTLASPEEVRGALGDAVLRKLMAVEGDPAGEFTLTVFAAQAH